VTAPIFYREVILPFSEASRQLRKLRWRLGRVADPASPPIVLSNLGTCGNCHTFSQDGSLLGMDFDHGNDKGAYVIARVSPKISLTKDNLISWNSNYTMWEPKSFGFLAQVSPDGRFVASTTREGNPVLLVLPDLAYSQLFFPVMGVISFYEIQTQRTQELPGANLPDYVQSNPVWTPDQKEIYFARSEAISHHEVDTLRAQWMMNRTPSVRFDIYRIPFNNGRGGVAEKVVGAADNGRSNYFPRFSPDQRWVVFCQANGFMLLQPDSELYIMPSGGGTPRRMRANFPGRMNSWHSWSPNGKWLVFASKANGPYTQLWLTHIDSEGNDSVPVLLDWFTSIDHAANIPEFVNLPGNATFQIHQNIDP
jgi:hypothetical protein